MAESKDYRQILTDKLIEQLEAGTAPWQKPWDAKEGIQRLPYNPTTGKEYRGVNSLYLSMHNREDPRWATYKQAEAKGWQVRKGEKGALVEYWKFLDDKPAFDDKGQPVLDENGKQKTISVKLEKPEVFRAVVFNAQQMDNVPELAKGPRMYEWDPVERAEKIMQSSGVPVFHDQNDKAFYSPASDEIHLPGRDQFPSQPAYYSTALHELGHSTGHESRLGRDLSGSFGSSDYAKEELRAELASYFLADKLGIQHDPGQHASYVKSWIKALQEDKNEIFRASRDAEKITDYVLQMDRDRTQEVAQDLAPALGKANELPGQTLRPHDIPDRGTPEYAVLLRQSIAERNRSGEYAQLNAEVVKQLGEGASFGMSAIAIPFRGVVIAESKHTFVLQTGPQEAVGLHKLEFRQLPTVGQEIAIEAPGIDDKTKGRGIGLVEPKRELATARTPLEVPFKEKEQAKALGAKWDKEAKAWFAPEGTDLKPLAKWLPQASQEQQQAAPAEAMEKQAHEMTVAEFEKVARVVKLENHGRKWEVFAGGKSGYSDAETPALAIRDSHRSEVNNALYWNAPDSPPHPQGIKVSMPPPHVLVEYPQLQEKFAAVIKAHAAPEKTWLAVPFKEKELAREAGAKWDKEAKAWFAPPGADLQKLDKWMPQRKVAQQAEQKQRLDPKAEFGEAIKAAGLALDGEPIMDGKLHRVAVEDGKKGNRDGAYVGYLDGKPSGFIQNFKTGLNENWTQAGAKLSPEEHVQLVAQTQLVKQQRAVEQAEQHEKAAVKAQAKYDRLPVEPPSGKNAYLSRKQIPVHEAVSHGLKFDGEKLVVPVRDAAGKLWSVQSISPEEGAPKMFEKGGRKSGNMLVIGEIKPGAPILVSEGYATGASLHLASAGQKAVAVAFDSGNLDAVVGALKERHPTSPIFIMGDNDKHAQQNVGVEKALAAAQKHQVGVAFPEFTASGKLSDFNDLHVKEGMPAVKIQVDNALAVSMEKSREQAGLLARQQLGEGAELQQPGQNTRHTGEVLGLSGYHATQATGKKAAVIHQMQDLDKVPEPGKVATIQYCQGRGQVVDRSLDQSKQQELRR